MQWLINYGLSSEEMVGNSRAFSVHGALSWACAGSRVGILSQHLSSRMLLRVAEEVGMLGPWQVNSQGAVSVIEFLECWSRWVVSQNGWPPSWFWGNSFATPPPPVSRKTQFQVSQGLVFWFLRRLVPSAYWMWLSRPYQLAVAWALD